jgi:hypothetical protein
VPAGARTGIGWVLGLVATAVLGAALALLAADLHRMVWRSAELTLPWGIVLGVTASVACAVAAGVLLGRRAGTLALAAGWLVTLFLLLRGRPEGDYVVASDALGWGFLVAGVATMAVLVGATLAARRADD